MCNAKADLKVNTMAKLPVHKLSPCIGGQLAASVRGFKMVVRALLTATVAATITVSPFPTSGN